MEHKRICIISPSLQMGGIERQLTILASHFVKRGHEVHFVAARAGQHFYELNPLVKFVEPSFVHTSRTSTKLWSYYKTIAFLRKQIKRIKPDTIMVFGDIINPIALIANKGLEYPIYIADQISPKQNLGRLKNFMKTITYRSATGIIAQSKMAADYKYEVFGNDINVRIIPNTMRDIEDCPNVERQPWVVSLGRLSYEKGADRLIDAFFRISGHKEWRLVLIGDGPMCKSLEAQAENLGIKDRVDFLGGRSDVDSLLAQSSIFVIPSRCEGFPNALCEAMASPLPCISFDSISASDLIENRVNGVVVPDGDIDGLAKEIEILMDNEKLRVEYAEKAYNIRERLDKDKVGDMFLDFILEKH
ncbi:glycosyltransferase [Butyricimonas virosa]|uniref:glycosyltransferase n=1 Tax=Butyricimonas virosa TaxID=544645 RepID=UPI003CFBCEBF